MFYQQRERQQNGGFSEVQTRCLAVGDGIDYEKVEQNPVLDEKELPEGGSRVDFRDPKMWRKADRSCCKPARMVSSGRGVFF